MNPLIINYFTTALIIKSANNSTGVNNMNVPQNDSCESGKKSIAEGVRAALETDQYLTTMEQLAFDMARYYASLGLQQYEASILIKQTGPIIDKEALFPIIEKAYALRPQHSYPALNEYSLAKYVLEQAQGSIRLRDWDNGFMFWTGTHWNVIEGEQKVEDAVKQILATLLERMGEPHQSAYGNWLNDPENHALLMTAVRMKAKRVPDYRLNNHLDLYLFENGWYSLYERKLVIPEMDDYMTDENRLNGAYDETADCPRWKEYISKVTQGDQRMMDFMQMLCAWILCIKDRYKWYLFVFWNQEGNGGTMMLKALQQVLGSYAAVLPSAFFSQMTTTVDDLSHLSRKQLLSVSHADFKNAIVSPRAAAVACNSNLGGWNRHHGEFRDFTLNGNLILLANDDPRGVSVNMEQHEEVIVIPFAGGHLGRRSRRSFAAMVDSEKNGILTWILQGYDMLLMNDGFLRVPDGAFYL